MKAVRAFARVDFFAYLPDDDQAADEAFDLICDGIAELLNDGKILNVARDSFSVTAADTEPDE